MRSLASIQVIKELAPIEGAEKIEVANVLGWHLVVKKGEFEVGQKCLYFEVDSFLPVLPVFSFLAKGGSLKKMLLDGKEIEGYRLKTIRLRGQISQGLALPLTEFLEIDPNAAEGEDVTELLGVEKYESPAIAHLGGSAIGVFPSFVPKTDETRIQSIPQVLEVYKDEPFYVTEKLDGTSMTVFIEDGQLHVCSRSLDWKESDDNAMWNAAKALNLKNTLELFQSKYVLQGELVGEGIQNNTLKIKGHRFFVFNIFDRIQGKYLDFADFIVVALGLGVQTVPVINTHSMLPESVDMIVEYATAKSRINPESWAEGYVFRPLHEIQDSKIGRLSFKAINPEFLLKYE